MCPRDRLLAARAGARRLVFDARVRLQSENHGAQACSANSTWWLCEETVRMDRCDRPRGTGRSVASPAPPWHLASLRRAVASHSSRSSLGGTA